MDNNLAATKKTLLHVLMKIKNASAKSMEILRDTCMTNSRVLERNSKSIKDPDPLSSAMANNSLKWPITLNMDRIKNIKDWNKSEIAGWDMRKRGRRVCSFKMVDNWIQSDNVTINPIDELAITKMFEEKKKRIIEVENVQWEKIQYKMIDVNLERATIQTNPIDIEIPSNMRDDVIAHVLCGDQMIEYRPLPREYIEEVKRLITEYHFESASIPNLLHFLKSQMDPKMRTLPVLPGMNRSFVDISHIMVQPRYRAINLFEYIGKEKGQNTAVSKVCMSVIKEYQLGTALTEIRKLASHIKISSVSFPNYLVSTEENIYVKSCKALLGYNISPSIQFKQMEMSPAPATLKTTTMKHHQFKGEITIIEGVESVSFKYKDTRGTFTHDGTFVQSITMKKVDRNCMGRCIAIIASFCKNDITKIDGKSMRKLRENLYNYHSTQPWKSIQCTETDWKGAMRDVETKPLKTDVRIGCLRMVENIDYIPAPPTDVMIRGNEGLNFKGQQILSMPIIKEVFWEEICNTSAAQFFKYLHPTTALIRSMQHIDHNIDYYVKLALDNRWAPPIPNLMSFVLARDRDALQSTCKESITQMLGKIGSLDKFLFSLHYSFVGEDYKSDLRLTDFIYNGKDNVSLVLERGIVLRGAGQKHGVVYGTIVSHGENNMDPSALYDSIIPGFVFSACDTSEHIGKKIFNLTELNAIKDEVKPRRHVYVAAQSRILKATKNNEIALDTYKTVKRSVQRHFIDKNVTKTLAAILDKKERKRKVDSSDLGPVRKSLRPASSILSIASMGNASSSSGETL